MSDAPQIIFCPACKGDGCRKCDGRGQVWSDGCTYYECREGVACARVAQCAVCPYVEELTAWKEPADGDQEA